MTIGGGGGASRETQSQESATGPWAPQAPYVIQGFEEAAKQLAAPNPQPYSGPTVAPPSQATLASRNMTLNTAANDPTPYTSANWLLNTLGGAYMPGGKPTSNVTNPFYLPAPAPGQTAAPGQAPGMATTAMPAAAPRIGGLERRSLLTGLEGDARREASQAITAQNIATRTATRDAALAARAAGRTGTAVPGAVPGAPGMAVPGMSSGVGGPSMAQINPAAGAVNPAAEFKNPERNAIAPTMTNAMSAIANQVADVENSYMAQPQNAYIDDLSSTIARDIIPQVQSQYAISGRTGSSAGAQEAMARGIADALAPYQFGSAEAEMGRRFAGGENRAQRQYLSGESLAGRQFAAGESQAERAQGAAEAQAARRFGAGESIADRLFAGGESALAREFMGGESALQRGLEAWNVERGRQTQAAAMAPAISAAQYAPAQAVGGVGAAEDAYNQAILDQQIADYYYSQNMDANQLAQYMGLITGNYGNTFAGQGASSGVNAEVGFKTGK